MKRLIVIATLTLAFATGKAQSATQDCFNKDKWHLSFCAGKKQRVLFRLMDSAGNVLRERKVKVFAGFNTPVVDMGSYGAGTYTIVLQGLLTIQIKH